jgi:hypothetical protein
LPIVGVFNSLTTGLVVKPNYKWENYTTSSSEICQPFFENAGTRPVRTQHKDNIFHGKRNFAKFTRSTIWGVQLKSGDNN